MNAPDHRLRPRVYRAALIAIVVLAGALRCWDLEDAFEYQGNAHQVNGAFYCVIARNYLKFGMREVAFAPVLGGGAQTPNEHVYYLRHPPLVGLLIAALFKLFGVSHVVARLPFLAMSLVALVGTAVLARRLLGEWAALVAALLMAVLPAGVLYGSFVDVQGSLVMGSSVLAVAAYLRYLERGEPLALAAVWLGCVLAALTDWPGYFAIALLGLHSLWFTRRWGMFATAAAIGASLLALHLWQTRAATGHVGAGGRDTLTGTLLHHSLVGLLSGGWVAGLTRFARQSGRYLVSMFTLPAVLLATCAALLGVRNLRRLSPAWGGVLVLLGIALLHVLIFPEAATRHDYWFIYLLPPVAIGAACLLDRLARGGRSGLVLAVVLLASTVTLGLAQARAQMPKPMNFFAPFGRALQAHTSPGDHLLTCEYPHIALVFSSDRLIRGKLSDDFFAATSADPDPNDPLQEGSPPHHKGVSLDKYFEGLHQAKWLYLGVRYHRFVIPLDRSSYPTHRHERVLELLRSWHPSQVFDSEVGRIEVFDLTRAK